MPNQSVHVRGLFVVAGSGLRSACPSCPRSSLVARQNARPAAGFVRGGIDFSHYDQVIISGPVIAFATPDKTQNPFRVTANQREQLVGVMQKALRSAFSNADNFALVEVPSSTALRLDVRIESIRVPQASSGTDAAIGRTGIFTPIDGKARVVLELSDAESREILAMGVDDQLISGTAIIEDGKFVSSWSEAAEICDRWAEAARKATDTLLG